MTLKWYVLLDGIPSLIGAYFPDISIWIKLNKDNTEFIVFFSKEHVN